MILICEITHIGYGEETLSIPHGPSFKKLVDLFSKSDKKLDKLIVLLRFVNQ